MVCITSIKKFISFVKKNFKDKHIIHTLAIYHQDQQKYGKNYFKNLKEILKFFNLDYIEYGKMDERRRKNLFLSKNLNLL